MMATAMGFAIRLLSVAGTWAHQALRAREMASSTPAFPLAAFQVHWRESPRGKADAMTEAEWLACTDPQKMLEFLRGKASDRKLRLVACACYRHVPKLFDAEKYIRAAVEVSERFADGLADKRELADALDRASLPILWMGGLLSFPTARQALMARKFTARTAMIRDAEEQHHVALLCCSFGNPFRPVALDPAWLRWHDGAIVHMAQAIYDKRRFQDLPILADALEEAGCTDPEILGHCRGPGDHVRGCWPVDLILGRS